MNEYFVAPCLDRQGTGMQSAPFATIERALAESRQADCPATILLQGGTHYLSEPIRLAASDRGLRIRAVVGERAVISGGLRLELTWRPFRDGIWQANVPKGLVADQLFVNGERQIWARYPNFNPDERIFNGYAADCVSTERARRWKNPAGGYLHAMHSHLWGGFHFRITGKNPDETLEMEGGWQNNRQSGLHPDYRFVEGIFEELDGPGEWFLDQESSTLYYYPPDGVDLDSVVIEIPRLRHLVELTGSETEPVRDVAIQGITFRHTLRTFMDTRKPLLRSDWTLYRGGTVLLAGCEDCRIDACDFVELGGNAVMVSGYNRRITLSGCHIDRAGAGGISFVGLPRAVRNPLFEYWETLPVEALDRSPGPRSNDYPADCLVDDCLITRIGRVEKQAAGIQIAMAARITVRHCSIHDVPRAGINIGDGCWGGHVVKHCDVFNTVLETGDHGSFNSWGRDRYWHPDIEETDRRVASAPDLPLLDVVEPVTLRNSRWRCDHGWDIDLDDGSSHYLIENNLCLNGGIKLREGYRRVCRNNITVNSTLHPHCWFRNSGDVLTRNIVFTEYQTTRVNQPWGEECDNNLLHLPGPAHTCAAGKLQKLSGRDEHSLAGNAQFLAPDSGDYRVRPESPAWALGFVNFPMDRFGVRSARLRALAATPELPGTIVSPEETAPVTIEVLEWRGLKLRNVAGLGDVSAAGLPCAEGLVVMEAREPLREGDVIWEINGSHVASLADFKPLASTLESESHVQLVIWRWQQKLRIVSQGNSLTGITGSLTTPAPASGAVSTSAALPPLRKECQERQRRVDTWYAPARFGLFFTWGMITGSEGYTGPLRYNTMAEFEAAAKDPDAIAANMVAVVMKAGARYVIYTPWHPFGYFVNYPTKESRFKWIAAKDYLGSLVNACDKQGLHLLLYANFNRYSQDSGHANEQFGSQADIDTVALQMINEIIDRHGEKIGGFWFDGNYTPDMGRLVRTRLPQGVVIHNNESGWGLTPSVDFGTTEFLSGPADPDYSRPTGLVKQHPEWGMMNPIRDFNEDIPEAGGWWYLGREDAFYQELPHVKDPTYLVKQMVSSLGQRRQWNFALGIGPMIDGTLPACFAPMIENTGRFLAWAGEAIYDTMGGEGSAFNPGWFNKGGYGSVTVSRKDPRCHYILVTTAPSEERLTVQNNGYQVASVVDLRSGKPVEFIDSGTLHLLHVDWRDVSEFGAKIFKVTLTG